MYCERCGKEIPDKSVFCLYCGEKQEDLSARFPQMYFTEPNPYMQLEENPKRKQSKLKIILSFLTLFLILGAIIITVFPIFPVYDGYSKLKQYEWGLSAEPILRDIGVQTIKEIREGTNFGVDIYITTERTDLDLLIAKDSSGNYEVLCIGVSPNCADFGKYYYYKDSLLKDEQGRYLKTVYNYTTNEVICKADQTAVLEYRIASAGQNSDSSDLVQMQRKEKIELAKKQFRKIAEDYSKSYASSDSKYSGHTYVVAGTVADIDTDKRYIVLESETRVAFYFPLGRALVLHEIHKGDTVIIKGTCDKSNLHFSATFIDCQVLSEDEL